MNLKVLVIFMWFVIPFLSIKATFNASRGGKVSVRSLGCMSEFFILLIKTLLAKYFLSFVSKGKIEYGPEFLVYLF